MIMRWSSRAILLIGGRVVFLPGLETIRYLVVHFSCFRDLTLILTGTMSCFSFFSRKFGQAGDVDPSPRPVYTSSYKACASIRHADRVSERETITETTEVASVEKEVAMIEYDSEEEEEPITLEVEKDFHLQTRLYRRGVLPSKLRMKKSEFCSKVLQPRHSYS